MTAPFDPRDPQIHDDPYPAYRALLAENPVSYVPGARTWFVSSHRDCRAVLTDPELSAAQGQRLRQRQTPLPVSMLNTDPPEHTRLRAAAAPAFAPEALTAARVWLAPLVGDAVAAALARLETGAVLDVVGDFGEPLAAETLRRFLGLPDADAADFRRWSRLVAVNLDPFAEVPEDDPAADAMWALMERCADRLAEPETLTDGALTVLAEAYAAGRITPGEALSTAGLLVVGGFDPLVAMVGNAVAALSTTDGSGNPPQDRLRTAVDELLRFDAPIQFTARRALSELEIGGRTVAAGDNVVVLLGSANRDPARFPDADRLRLDRRSNPHLAFGAGPHACLGAPLVRLFGTLLIEAVPGRPPRLDIVDVARSTATVPRGHTRLRVRRRSGQ